MVVGAPEIKPTKKALAAQKRMQAQPALSAVPKGQDPTVTTVDKAIQDDHKNSGRPDKAAYDKEQAKLKEQIDALQAKSNDVKTRIANVSGKGPNHERKVQLRAELDSLRSDQARIKGGRGKTLDQVKAMQDNIAKKIKELQLAKAKISFKSVAEVDNQIKSLERQVESGTMKLVDEKKALQEISTLRKSRKTVESFAAQQAAIDEDKKKIDEIRATMDDPEAKAISDKFNAVRAELDGINKQHDEASKGRDALFEERNAISKQLDEVYGKKKELANAFHESNNKYYQKMKEDREKRNERQQADRKAFEDSKRAEVNQRLLEEAQAPAFEREIEDCRTLIDTFNKRIGNASAQSATGSSSLYERAAVAGVPQLELRKVDDAPPAGAVALKKKSDQEEESWGGFGGKKGKKGGKKSSTAPAENGDAATSTNASSQALNLPFGTLSALLSLGISAPLTVGEVPKTIEALEIKKKYFTDNQERVTKERVAAAEKKIASAEAKSTSNGTEAKTNGSTKTAEVVANGAEKKEEQAAEVKTTDAVADAPEEA